MPRSSLDSSFHVPSSLIRRLAALRDDEAPPAALDEEELFARDDGMLGSVWLVLCWDELGSGYVG